MRLLTTNWWHHLPSTERNIRKIDKLQRCHVSEYFEISNWVCQQDLSRLEVQRGYTKIPLQNDH